MYVCAFNLLYTEDDDDGNIDTASTGPDVEGTNDDADEACPDEARPDKACPDEARPDKACPDEARPDKACPDEACGFSHGVVQEDMC
jgi:hypothetical protein